MSNLIGKSAPTFPVLKDQDGADFDISSVIGKEPCVIFFYPQAMTYGCTKEACAIRDISNKPTFLRADSPGTQVMRIIGISSDTHTKQKEFATKHDLGYTLLADTEQLARKAYGVTGSTFLGLVPQRVTFIVDQRGTVKATEDSSISMAAHTKLVEKWATVFAGQQGTQTQAIANLS